MKICFIFPKHAPSIFEDKLKYAIGGNEIQLYLYANELSKYKNLEVKAMLIDYGQNEIIKCNQITLYKSYKINDNQIKKIYKFHKIFKKINADIYIQMGLSHFSGLLSKYCKILGKKFIFIFASDVEVKGNYQKNNKKIIFLKTLLKNSDLIITQNEFQQNYLFQYFKKKSMIISTSFPINISKKIKKEWILWVSRCDKLKNPEIFLELAKNFPNEKFVMIAPPIDLNYQKEIKQKALTIKNLSFIDHVPFEKIQEYFNKAKIFVNTSNYEGFPNTFIQAGIGSTPILSLNVNPNNFLIEHNCGFVCNGNFNLLNENLNKFLNNKKLSKKMFRNIYNYVKKNHDIEVNIKKLYTLITNQ